MYLTDNNTTSCLSCNLKIDKSKAELKIQDRPSVAFNILVHEGKVCLQDRCADMKKVYYPRIIISHQN